MTKTMSFAKLCLINSLLCSFLPVLIFGPSSSFPWALFLFFWGMVAGALTYSCLYKALNHDAGVHNRAIRILCYLLYGPLFAFLFHIFYGIYSHTPSGESIHKSFLDVAMGYFAIAPTTALITAPLTIPLGALLVKWNIRFITKNPIKEA